MKRRFIFAVCVALIFMSLSASHAYAEEIEEIEDNSIVKKEEVSGPNKLVYTGEDVKNGIIVVPEGTYDTIQVTTNLKKAVMYLDNVTVKKYISVYGGKSRKITIVMTDKSDINIINARRNTTVLCDSKKARVGTVIVNGDGLTVDVSAVTKKIDLKKETTNSTVNVSDKTNYLNVYGQCNKINTYGTIKKAYIYGEYNKIIAHEKIDETLIFDSGNRLTIDSKKYGKVRLFGTNIVLEGLTDGKSKISMGEIEVNSGSYQLERGERLGKVVDLRDNEYLREVPPGDVEELYIGDSFIEYLYMKDLLKKNKYGLFGQKTWAKDWYIEGERQLNYFGELPKYDPKKIIFYYGINGIAYSDNIEYSQKLLDDLMRFYPNAKIYVQRVFPVTNAYTGVGDHDYRNYNHSGEMNVDKYNLEMEKFCRKNTNLIWCDCTGGFIDGNGDLKREYSNDAIHLTPEGYEKWFSNIKNAIK